MGSCIDPDIILGTNGVLVVGESPKGPLSDCLLSPTLRRLAANLKEVGIILSDCSFTEICKCELLDRKDFPRVSKVCFPSLKKQIEDLEPKLVITIGKQANQIFSEHYGIEPVMGELVYGKNLGFGYLPLWHTSPINPHGFARNQEILLTSLTK